MTLTFKIRDGYGQIRYYPVCTPSKVIAELTERKTLSKPDIKKLEKAGFTIVATVDSTLRSRSKKKEDNWEHA